MTRETQLDTHDIDKLLEDEDFIDDFDFSQSAEEPIEKVSGEREEPKKKSAKVADQGLDEDLLFDPIVDRDIAAPASEKMVSEVVEELDQDAFDLDFFSPGEAKEGSRGIKITAGLLVLFWFVQLGVVVWLLRKPPQIPAVRQKLVAIEMPTAKSSPLPVAETKMPPASPAVALEPTLCAFSIYLPIYSLTGLKVYSADLQIIQLPGAACLSDAEQERLRNGLRGFLQGIIGEKLFEEQTGLKERLEAGLNTYTKQYLQSLGRNLKKFKIRLVSSLLE
jgi:hypothetical protein